MAPEVPKALLRKLRPIRMVIMDADGVLTDGRIICGSDGTEYRSFHAHDGFGIKRAADRGFILAIISGKTTPVVSRRARTLGIREVFQGADDKVAPFNRLRAKYGLEAGQVCFIGDDEFDLPLLTSVGFSAAPADAIPAVLRSVDYVARSGGGRGAVREVLDLILRAQRSL